MIRFVLPLLLAGAAQAQVHSSVCAGLPDAAKLKAAAQAVVHEGQEATTGLGNEAWATVVNRDGIVCAVVFTGADRHAQWLASRMIAAEKASTANSLSTDKFAISTGNLWAAAQPGGSLYSLTSSAPANTGLAREASGESAVERYGRSDDPLVGKLVGGAIVFGGGLELYDAKGKAVGGLGLSGDTSCADHVNAWKVRHALKLDRVPKGVAPDGTDNLILDIQGGVSASGFGHPSCKGGKPSDEVIRKLPVTHPVPQAAAAK